MASGLCSLKKIKNLLSIVIAVGAALAILVVKLIVMRALLSISTSAFVLRRLELLQRCTKAFGYAVGYNQVSKLLPPPVDEALRLFFHSCVIIETFSACSHPRMLKPSL